MILISHRGNITGPNKEMENKPEYIEKTLKMGYDVEVDVWCFGDGGYWLGHDKPQYHVDESFLHNKKLWCHAKNIQGLYSMLEDSIHCFFHQEDDVTLTSKGYMWTYPGKDLTKNSIAVLPEKVRKLPPDSVAGVCSDYIGKY
tara:strand:+ start:250 stop:678 length:429 start_codon:yes stop_codon:yes gene_type:complete